MEWKHLWNRFRTELRWRRRMARRTTDVDWHSLLRFFPTLFAALVVFIWIGSGKKTSKRMEQVNYYFGRVHVRRADDSPMDEQDTPFRLQFHIFFLFRFVYLPFQFCSVHSKSIPMTRSIWSPAHFKFNSLWERERTTGTGHEHRALYGSKWLQAKEWNEMK